MVTTREVDIRAAASLAPLTITTREQVEVSLVTNATVTVTIKTKNSTLAVGPTQAPAEGVAHISSVTNISREATVTITTIAETITKTEEINPK